MFFQLCCHDDYYVLLMLALPSSPRRLTTRDWKIVLVIEPLCYVSYIVMMIQLLRFISVSFTVFTWEQGRTQEGLTGLKPPPRNSPIKII